VSPVTASRVLVADDVKDSADTVVELLATQGIEARAVYDGLEALKLAESWHPDSAVLDLALPGLSGYELARELRGRFGEEIRLVAYTGWSGAREQARGCGFDEFLVKPVDPATLLIALGRPIADLVRRSVEVRVEQLRRQIELGHSLLKHGFARPEALGVISAFLERAFHACRTTMADLPMGSEARRQLEQDLDGIERLIALARSGNPPEEHGS
jgi:CheY-like chemotaxis protein